MRILLAYDGSAGAETAVRLVLSLRAGSGAVRAVTVVPPARPLLGRAGAVDGHRRRDHQVDAALAHGLQEATADLEPSVTVERRLLRGRPADAIVRAARSFEADLVVTGSRGRGPLASMLLGSVAAEVAVASPVPALIARSDTITSILLAVDGSPHARAAEDVLIRLPVMPSCPVLVVSVVPRPGPWPLGEAAVGPDDANRADETAVAQAAAAAVRRLKEAGIAATDEVRRGDPTGELLAAADEHGVDVIALGTRGYTGMRRLLMGSVARNVLENSPTSVLIARASRRRA